MTTTLQTTDLDTAMGPVRVALRHDAFGGEVVVACSYTDHWDRLAVRLAARFPDATWTTGPSAAADAVKAYLAGDLTAIDSLAVETGGTEFQQKVWAALRTIPVGETRSYLDIATAAGDPKATRAVGTANGANPVWLIVPCHRVIRADGNLGGYGGGLDRKAWLLAHEGARLA